MPKQTKKVNDDMASNAENQDPRSTATKVFFTKAMYVCNHEFEHSFKAFYFFLKMTILIKNPLQRKCIPFISTRISNSMFDDVVLLTQMCFYFGRTISPFVA
ncbi:uncharacterized protein LOC143224195 isoform X2 [Tachypleus tridentatus]|uniref:uncharacterized protein LOC143224180 n=1 Tax=Tachypleus tridentatus TaxID=6853 RepID=UPI003FD149B3